MTKYFIPTSEIYSSKALQSGTLLAMTEVWHKFCLLLRISGSAEDEIVEKGK